MSDYPTKDVVNDTIILSVSPGVRIAQIVRCKRCDRLYDSLVGGCTKCASKDVAKREIVFLPPMSDADAIPERPPTIIPVWSHYGTYSFNHFYQSERFDVAVPFPYAPAIDSERGVVIRSLFRNDAGKIAREVYFSAIETIHQKAVGKPGTGFEFVKAVVSCQTAATPKGVSFGTRGGE